ncbi:MAG: UDP-glucuronic acid decarboxylase family protein, partial [Ktedonobacteraceae bacterium]
WRSISLKIVVTGGAGFIGSHLCARLLEDGHSVLCVDNLLTGSEQNIESLRHNSRFTFLQHDVTQPFNFEAEAIYHLASPASPVGYMENPIATIMVNSLGTYQMLEQARRQKALFLFTSTSEAYGDPLVHPQREDYWGNVNPVGPRACYDESKRLGETLTMEYYRQFQVNARMVRIFNTYGPNSQADDGRMIPNFITQALQNKPLTIYGDGSITRSICYVSDLVEGLLLALFKPFTAGEIFNLGNTEELTVLEFAQTIIRLCQSSSTIIFEPGRIDDPERRRPDISKAQRALGWQHNISTEEGLKRTIAWFSTQMSRVSTVTS